MTVICVKVPASVTVRTSDVSSILSPPDCGETYGTGKPLIVVRCQVPATDAAGVVGSPHPIAARTTQNVRSLRMQPSIGITIYDSANGSSSSPAESRRDVCEDRLDHVRVVLDAERVRNGQQ